MIRRSGAVERARAGGDVGRALSVKPQGDIERYYYWNVEFLVTSPSIRWQSGRPIEPSRTIPSIRLA